MEPNLSSASENHDSSAGAVSAYPTETSKKRRPLWLVAAVLAGGVACAGLIAGGVVFPTAAGPQPVSAAVLRDAPATATARAEKIATIVAATMAAIPAATPTVEPGNSATAAAIAATTEAGELDSAAEATVTARKRELHPIAKVGNVSLSIASYQKSYRFQAYQFNRTLAQMRQMQAQYAGDDAQKLMYDYLEQSIQQMQSRQQTLPMEAFNTLIDDELIRQEAARRGITVTPDELQKELEVLFGYDRNAPAPAATAALSATEGVTVTAAPEKPPMTEDQFKQLYATSLQQFQKVADMSEADFHALFRTSLLRDKLEKAMQSEVVTTTEQIRARHILIVPTEPTDTVGLPADKLQAMQTAARDEARAKAEAALKRVTTGGEDFAAVAAEVSNDPGSKDKGGDLDWHPRGDFVSEFEDVAWALQPGQIYTDVVESQFGFHVVKLEERDANHPLSEQALQARQSEVLANWLTTANASDEIERFWSPDLVPLPLS